MASEHFSLRTSRARGAGKFEGDVASPSVSEADRAHVTRTCSDNLFQSFKSPCASVTDPSHLLIGQLATKILRRAAVVGAGVGDVGAIGTAGAR